jgi:hypothetical protein
MTHGTDSPDGYRDVIAQMRQVARERITPPAALLQVQQRIATQRQQSSQRLLEALAARADLNLNALFHNHLQGADATEREIDSTLEALEAEARERAHARRAALHRARTRHGDAFTSALPFGDSQLKFRHPFSWFSEAQPSSCSETSGPFWEPHIRGEFEATADMSIGEENAGVWLHPHISGKNHHCWGTTTGRTIHELIYHMPAPQSAMTVQHVRVDLIGSGVGIGVEGTTGTVLFPVSGFVLGPPAAVHLDIQLGQFIGTEWYTWPLVAETLFINSGDYVREILLNLPTQTYSANLPITRADSGGGPLLCFVQLSCSAWPAGRHGQVTLSFKAPESGIFLGGVALLGKYDQPLLEG